MKAEAPGAAAPPFARRRWWRILPLVFITFSLAYVDRANYGFAAVAGMAADLKIGPRLFSLIGAFFFAGYFVFQIPGAIYAQRQGVKKLIFASLLLWGTCASLTGIVSRPGWLLLVRFVLGVAEAAVIPALLIYLSHWFTRAERSRANTFLILGNPVTILWMSVLTGYLLRSLNWRWMFVAEGLPAVVWALLWWWLAAERPEDAGWLTPGEKAALAGELAHEQKALGSVQSYREAFRSPAVLLLAGQYFCWSLGAFGFILWLPSILKETSAFGIVATGWLSALPYLVAIIAMLANSALSDRARERKRYVWPFLLAAAAAFLGSCLLGADAFWLSYALLVLAAGAMFAPYGPFWAIVPEILPQNVAGGATALVNSMGALGSFAGAYIIGSLNTRTGSPRLSYFIMAGALAAASLLIARLPTCKVCASGPAESPGR